MIAKVKVKMDFNHGSPYYEVRSKSLTAALQRATLLVEVLGDDRVNFEYAIDDYSKKKPRHYFYVYTKNSDTE